MKSVQYLIALIFALLVIYTASVNFAISEGFEKEYQKKETNLLRQELEEREESFLSRLDSFYQETSDLFSSNQNSEKTAKFVSRTSSFAQANVPTIRWKIFAKAPTGIFIVNNPSGPNRR